MKNKEEPKKRASKYNEKVKINVPFEEAIKILISSPKHREQAKK